MTSYQLSPGPGARRVIGPTALGGDPRRFWHLARTLAVTDFKLRFFGSVLGYLWQLFRPLLLFGVLLLVFSEFFRFGTEVRFYPVALLLGIVLFNFLAESTTAAIRSLVARESLIRKIEFPRLAVPAASVLTALFNLTLNMIPVLLFLLVMGGSVRWQWVELPVLVATLALFASGLAMLLSALFVRYRDVEPMWEVALQILFYASPIIYSLQMVSSRTSPTVAHLLMINPFTMVLQQARHAVVDPSHISAAAAIGGVGRLAAPLGVIALVVVLGYAVFNRAAPTIAEDL